MGQRTSIVDKDKIYKFASDLSAVTSHPEFLRIIQQAKDAPASERQRIAEENATVSNVTSKGISVPAGFRITTRKFEEPVLARVHATDAPEQDPMVILDDECAVVVYHGLAVTVKDKGASGPLQMQSPTEIRSAIQQGIEEIGQFVAQPEFQELVEELYALPEADRKEFVLKVVLDPDEQAKRGIFPPKGMLIQRSAFADRRPTLFCVAKKVSSAYPWQKVTVTFDSN